MKNKVVIVTILILFGIIIYLFIDKNKQLKLAPIDHGAKYYNKQIDSLMNVYQISKAKNTLDSLIQQDSTQGSYYFNRGFCNTQLLYHKEAINDFKKSISLNYKKDQSNEMIKFNQSLF